MYGDLTVGTPPLRLRYRVFSIAGLGLLALSVVVSPVSDRWLAAVTVWVAVVGYTRYRLGQNHVSGADAPEERLGVANAVTLVRGWLVALFAGVITTVSPGVSAAVLACAVLLDAVDGAVARRTRETVLGARLDGATDALALLVGATAAAVVGVLPAWYALAGAVWYGYSAALWARRRAGGAVYDLPESRLRPLVGSGQFLLVVVALWPAVVVPGPVAALALAALLASFGRDLAAATGRLG